MPALENYLAIAVSLMGLQSSGSVTLRSSNLLDLLIVGPKFLADPFDRRATIDSVKKDLRFVDTPILAKDQVRLATGPDGKEDE